LQQDENALILEGMPERVTFKDFAKHSSAEAKHAFKKNVEATLAEIHRNQIQHGNICDQTVWTDIKGNVKFAWFSHASLGTRTGFQKDLRDMCRLCLTL
jgi:hypothetical protein